MDIVWRAALGGLFIGLILFASRRFGPTVAGLFISFPFASLPAYYYISVTEGSKKLHATLISSLMAFPIWIAFTTVFYLASLKYKIGPTIVISLLVWILGAFLLMAIKKSL